MVIAGITESGILRDRIQETLVRGEFAIAAEALKELLTDHDITEDARHDALLQLALCHAILADRAGFRETSDDLVRRIDRDGVAGVALDAMTGWDASHGGDPEECVRACTESLARLRALGTDRWIPETARWLGHALQSQGRTRPAIQAMYESLGAAERLGEARNIALAKLGLARIHRIRAHYAEALALRLEAYEGFAELGAPSMVARIALDISVVARLTGDLSAAQEYSGRAVALAEESAWRGVLFCRISRARILFQLGRASEAEALWRSVLSDPDPETDPHATALAHEDLGDLLSHRKDYPGAADHYRQAWESVRETSPGGEVAGELAWRIGLNRLRLGEPADAERWVRKGLDICGSNGDTKEEALTIRAYGIVLCARGRRRAGHDRLRAALRRLRSIHVPFEVGRTLLEIARALGEENRPDRARRCLASAGEVLGELNSPLGAALLEAATRSAEEEDPASLTLHERVTEDILELHDLKEEPVDRTTPMARTALAIPWRSRRFRSALDRACHYAKSSRPVLILGESGAGKTSFAEILHRSGSSPEEPFLVVNCASLPETLQESELFGHVRGAFTGAEAEKPGLIRAARSGTVFLDEIDKASSSMQANLLHVLDRHEVRPVGGHRSFPANARFVFATNRNLHELAMHGEFLPDLAYRLGGLCVAVPALRERREDFDLLLALALRVVRSTEGSPPREISVEGRNLLSTYSWPGNIRELFSLIHSAALLTPDSRTEIGTKEIEYAAGSTRFSGHLNQAQSPEDLPARLTTYEKEEILQALRLDGGSQHRAARRLGISRRSLNKRLHRFGLLDQIREEGLTRGGFRERGKVYVTGGGGLE
ncbi:MAG: sigma 54-interacting transcriptional regulator [Gemmatimonadota bacterium]|jgi:DNA-binding NtrC family response regulator/tetratricopeptide (TPR) repeat protein|nr:sigma 54-interacting transcriptional regulator [Gemmatimonadota bacterium]MDP6802021.1 sigma 54-interacting transcriptional regulator [Gemmatimonadota bacterium]MDP7031369.1 sigma 54-interacting transcriptional regulator [Gemmatimonadota bacterium]